MEMRGRDLFSPAYSSLIAMPSAASVWVDRNETSVYYESRTTKSHQERCAGAPDGPAPQGSG